MLNYWDNNVVKKLETDWNRLSDKGMEHMFSLAEGLGDSFIDLGCGYGRFLEFLKKNHTDLEYFGYDSSISMITLAMQRNPGYSFSVADITAPLYQWMLVNHYVDVVVCNEVLIHLPIVQQPFLLRNIGRVNFEHLLLSIQYGDKIREEIVSLENQQFHNIVQNKNVFVESLIREVGGIESISETSFHLIGDVWRLNIHAKRIQDT